MKLGEEATESAELKVPDVNDPMECGWQVGFRVQGSQPLSFESLALQWPDPDHWSCLLAWALQCLEGRLEGFSQFLAPDMVFYSRSWDGMGDGESAGWAHVEPQAVMASRKRSALNPGCAPDPAIPERVAANPGSRAPPLNQPSLQRQNSHSRAAGSAGEPAHDCLVYLQHEFLSVLGRPIIQNNSNPTGSW